MANAIRKGFMPSAMHLQDIAMHPQDICHASAKCLPCICKMSAMHLQNNARTDKGINCN